MNNQKSQESLRGNQKSIIGKISTGSSDLNNWLNGGYEKNVVTMIVGPPGSGKSNFGILAACSRAINNEKVVFIDTEGGFSLDRVMQIVGENNYEKVLSNIFILEPTNFSEQRESFSKINNYLKEDQVGLIVVDSMAMHYRLEMGDAVSSKKDDAIQKINRDIAKQMRTLVEIARKKEIPIIITNQVYSSFLSSEDLLNGVEKETSIVGGDLFKYWSKCIIELFGKGKNRYAKLLKHRSLDVKDFNFEIKDAGIFKKSSLF